VVFGITERAAPLIMSGQVASAALRVRGARAVQAHHQAATRLESQLCQRVLENARAALRQGKVSRAADELACLNELGRALPARHELADLVATAQQAGACVQAGQYAEARRHAMSLARQLPEAEWVAAVADQLRQLEELHTALSAGPLGDRVSEEAARKAGLGRRVQPVAMKDRGQNLPFDLERAMASPAKIDLNDTVPIPARVAGEGVSGEPLLLLVDGGGSFLVLRGGVASVGRAASEHPADVPIFSDAAERHANIQRLDDDYFLFCVREVEVAGRPVRHTLLRDGDKVVLGRKAKFTFRLPSRKSATAVLEMSDTTKMPNDVRRVILLHHHAGIGNGPSAHIPCRHAGTPLVLYERNGALWVRPRSDGHVDTEPKELRIGEQVEVCGATLVLERWKLPQSGTRV